MQGKGLSGSYKFTRGPCIYSTTMVAVEVTLVNNTEAPISNICVGEKVKHYIFVPLYSPTNAVLYKTYLRGDVCRAGQIGSTQSRKCHLAKYTSPFHLPHIIHHSLSIHQDLFAIFQSNQAQ